ncbi:MAG: hypothetical protein A2268_00915 [Candidatus Raymondbacteria bacterium RifOxyA12_full_50_37]|uniref:SpoVG family protein n=1 Tax=Candidatus Raymondbacteria bacterium RIFOXYD12_FULL_49_13 TaxID=1817890 RepID=A0A1F7FFM1_UNCRA|nr:MAG: hypothetical protein A2268_00915 [Candidatus Raymondbacteria bacterium RifOxyA12_full_50_37]OGJ86364.1 MAG: hypothetical protein A2248_13880 [Candidatus Raymondbacteria bacterium RIFOXYA2_FULL_49_16]OGJ95534.1 MAG: hypothetical protein A2453_12655 [Candidatus Raymondbacteria bacterium RIFOXYC2_FULL_50_21]OGJ96103.1 MAG: hypothetical protein A2487_01730 [Candidatus Raymondbacteria bacterium RifOxyC12_full_50_8]OGJ96255.1 MAG: hypothetical protein A2350_02315 [Candidatus Raymondbacteria b
MTELDITELRIYPVKERRAGLLAFCTATLNNALVITGIRIVEGKKGVSVAFPVKNRQPAVYFTSDEARKQICDRILATYIINHCVDDYGERTKQAAQA